MLYLFVQMLDLSFVCLEHCSWLLNDIRSEKVFINKCFLFLFQGPGHEMRTWWGSRKEDETGGGWGGLDQIWGQEEAVEDRKRTRKTSRGWGWQPGEEDDQHVFVFGTCRVPVLYDMKSILVFLPNFSFYFFYFSFCVVLPWTMWCGINR